MIYLLQGHSHLISEKRKKADQLPGNSFANSRGRACDIAVLIVAPQRFYECCLSPPEIIKIILVLFPITYAHIKLISMYVCLPPYVFSCNLACFNQVWEKGTCQKQPVNTSQIEEGQSVNHDIETELVI